MKETFDPSPISILYSIPSRRIHHMPVERFQVMTGCQSRSGSLVISPALAVTNKKFRLSGPHACSNDIPQMDEAIHLEARASWYCKEGGREGKSIGSKPTASPHGCFHKPLIPPLPSSSPPATSAPVRLLWPQHGNDLGNFQVRPCGTKLNEQDALSS